MFNRRAISIFWLFFICAICFLPPTHGLIEYLDHKIFFLANSVLSIKALQYFFGYLNHSYERKLNLVFVIAVSILAYIYSDKSQKRENATNIAAIFVGLQLWLAIINLIFTDILDLTRDSPSLALPLQYNLSEIFNDPEIKISSTRSFPGGHAFTASYWWLSLCRYSSSRISMYAFIVALLMIIPRIFVGAHWFSDVLFAMWFAALAVQIDLYTRLWYYYGRIIKLLIRVIKCFKLFF